MLGLNIDASERLLAGIWMRPKDSPDVEIGNAVQSNRRYSKHFNVAVAGS